VATFSNIYFILGWSNTFQPAAASPFPFPLPLSQSMGAGSMNNTGCKKAIDACIASLETQNPRYLVFSARQMRFMCFYCLLSPDGESSKLENYG
jgi:hypothetical protein